MIGNSAYKSTGALANPKNDATDVAAALASVGFEVIEGLDLDKAAMDRKVGEFAVALAASDVALFFYAGHGLQVSGVNYLVPIDAEATTTATVDWQMVRFDHIQHTMERSDAKTKILFLDACRDNPLARTLERAMGTRSVEIGRGLAAAAGTGKGTLISFSTEPGQTAADGTGRNSPFAGPLARRIPSPGQDLSQILIGVRNDVMAATGDKQRPWEHSSLTGQFYFLGGPAGPQEAPSSAGRAPDVPLSEAERAWTSIQHSIDVAILDAYVRQFPDSFYAALARNRRNQLSPSDAKPVAAATPSPKPAAPAEGAVQPAMDMQAQTRARPLPAEAERALNPRDRFKECDVCPEVVVVTTGQFTMGSPEDEEGHEPAEGPQRKVTIGKTFAAGRFEVTFAEWDACVAAGGCARKSATEWGRGRQPVMRVSWDDISNEYLPWLRRKTGKFYRLLTEAEWEYAARAWTTTPFSTGPTISTDLANFDGSAAYGGGPIGVYRNKTLETGTFQPNAFGLFDMHGNVWEWVEDCYEAGYAAAPTDGSARGTKSCETRVYRGGSWHNEARGLRSASRRSRPSAERHHSIGFRVARTLSR